MNMDALAFELVKHFFLLPGKPGLLTMYLTHFTDREVEMFERYKKWKK